WCRARPATSAPPSTAPAGTWSPLTAIAGPRPSPSTRRPLTLSADQSLNSLCRCRALPPCSAWPATPSAMRSSEANGGAHQPGESATIRKRGLTSRLLSDASGRLRGRCVAGGPGGVVADQGRQLDLGDVQHGVELAGQASRLARRASAREDIDGRGCE